MNVRPRARLPWSRGPNAVTSSISLVTVALIIAMWEVLPNSGLIDKTKYPALSTTFRTLWNLIAHEHFADQFTKTLERFFAGLLLGTLVGLLLGIALGMLDRIQMTLQPLVVVLYTVPRVALFPIILIWLGLNENAVWIMVSTGPLFVMLIATIEGIRNVSGTHLDVACSFGCSRLFMIRKVVAPAALRSIMAGFKISIGVALFATIAVEFLFESSGLGYFVWHSWGTIQMNNAMAGAVTAAIIGIVSYGLAAASERAVIRWRP